MEHHDHKPASASRVLRTGFFLILLCLVRAGGARPAAAQYLDQPGTPHLRLQSPVAPNLSAPETITPSLLVAQMIDLVDWVDLRETTGGLSGAWPIMVGGQPFTLATRYTGNALATEKATQYAYEQFQSMGLQVSYHDYVHPYGQRRNVVAQQTGVVHPEKIHLVVAHLDSTSPVANTLAPGADDNASGSAGVLAAAAILSQYDFDDTIRYVLFTGEEQGLYGSKAYAAYVYSLGENIAGVLNLDMIAYNTPRTAATFELHTRNANAGDLSIANTFIDAVSAYSLSLAPILLQDGETASDHSSFWNKGYSAILAIEDWSDHTPSYHTVNDTLDTLNSGYFTTFTQAALATAAHLGGIREASLAGTVFDAFQETPLAGASIQAQRSDHPPLAAASAGDGSYSLVLQPATYAITATLTGYLPFTSSVTLANGQALALDIPLLPCISAVGADFTYTPALPLSGDVVTFTASLPAGSTPPVSISWRLGEQVLGSGTAITHTFTTGGAYPLTMTASNCAGEVSATQTIQVLAVPILDLQLPATLEVTLEAGETLSQALRIGNTGDAALDWSLATNPPPAWLSFSPPSGSLDADAQVQVGLLFQAPEIPSVYSTTLALDSNDPRQPRLDLPASLSVPCHALTGLNFTVTPPFPWVGEIVSLEAAWTAGSQPVALAWNFGDGSPPAAGASIQHAFPFDPARQAYTVTLRGDNPCSAGVIASREIPVRFHWLFLPVMLAPALNGQ